MTAPAEDPRGGEVCRCGLPKRTAVHGNPFGAGHAFAPDPPAVGRGDTDSGGERLRAAEEQARFEQYDGYLSTETAAELDAARAARPAGDRAQPTQELREAIARWLYTNWGGGLAWTELHDGVADVWRDRASELIAGPLAALLDAEAAVNRVEELLAEAAVDSAPAYSPMWVDDVRRALDGTT